MSSTARAMTKLIVVCVALCIQACTGEVDFRFAPDGTGPGGIGGPGYGPPSGTAPLRRLTNKEYNNTIADLLNDTTAPADAFPGATTSIEGFDNFASGLGVSATHAESMLYAAEAIATRAIGNLQSLLNCSVAQLGETTCAQTFISRFGERAFRRPLTSAENSRMMAFWTSVRATRAFPDSIRLVLEAFLLSPAFLYRVEYGSPGAAGSLVSLTSWEMASRLSYFFTGSMPDAELFRAARADELTDPARIEAQARRLLGTARARDIFRQFADQWLELRGITSMQKNAALFEGYNDALKPFMKEEANRLFDSVVWEGNGDIRTLFSADYTFMNGPLATFYGVGGVTGNNFVRVNLDPSKRKGLLTLAGVLAAHGKPNETLPVRRGRFIRTKLFCIPVSDPPPGAIETAPQRAPGMTVREFFTEVEREPACGGCHKALDGVGFGLESFNSVGQWRELDQNRPVDSSGELVGTDVDGPYNGGVELAHRVSESQQVTECVVRQVFRFASGRHETDSDEPSLGQLNENFQHAGFNIRELLISLTQNDAFLRKRSHGAGP